MSFRDFWLFLGLVLFVNSQNYPQQQTRQHSNYQYDRQRQDYYRQQTQRPSHHQNYYRTDSPNQYNISAINYSNKFQKSVITSTTSTTVEPPKRYHTSTNQNVYSNVHYRQHHQTTHQPSFGNCNVPSDFWCDSHEIAQKCGVVQQCEHFKRQNSPITVTLMFEALCPFCQRFISNHLGNLYDQFRGKIELELVPWGNSRLLPNGQISCNHGQSECDANRLMSCAIDIVKTKQAIPFIVCFERQLTTYPQVEQAMHHCSTFIRNDYREIRQCYNGEKGRQLQRQAAYRTMNIRAHPIIEVPYIVINNYSPSTDANGLNIMSLQMLLNKWLNMRQK